MAKYKHDVFLSYRSQGGKVCAQLVRTELIRRGVGEERVFMDTHTLHENDFEKNITEAINTSKSVVVVISKGCFEQEKNPDYFLYEIEKAFELNKTVIPLFFDGISSFDEIKLPESIKQIEKQQAIKYVHEFSDAVFDKLASFIRNPKEKRKIIAKITSILIVACALSYFGITLISNTQKNVLSPTWAKGISSEQKNVIEGIIKEMVASPDSTFFICKHEVTNREWNIILGKNDHEGFDNYPVCNVTRIECDSFLQVLDSLSGIKFFYPTSMQWVIAARGGEFHAYAGSDSINEVAWYGEDEESGRPHPVGLKKANKIGVYDMSGNVWEICVDNETGIETYRGGCFASSKNKCRVDNSEADEIRIEEREKQIAIFGENIYIEPANLGLRIVVNNTFDNE